MFLCYHSSNVLLIALETKRSLVQNSKPSGNKTAFHQQLSCIVCLKDKKSQYTSKFLQIWQILAKTGKNWFAEKFKMVY